MIKNTAIKFPVGTTVVDTFACVGRVIDLTDRPVAVRDEYNGSQSEAYGHFVRFEDRAMWVSGYDLRRRRLREIRQSV